MMSPGKQHCRLLSEDDDDVALRTSHMRIDPSLPPVVKTSAELSHIAWLKRTYWGLLVGIAQP